jgi:hypothetical protein
MINESLITKKVSELVFEAQTGIKRPKVYHAPDVVLDSVTISEQAKIVQRMTSSFDGQKDPQGTANVALLKKWGKSGGYAVSEEIAEKIARQILGLTI